MNKLPGLCIVDTNVPLVANLAAQSQSADDADIPVDCIEACVDAVEHVIKTRGLVLDDGGEIFDEYMNKLSLAGQPGVGDKFMKWVHDYQYTLADGSRVTITGAANSYEEFPQSEGLENFDISDRKFVAVAAAHPEKPPILQATDSKWIGWQESLEAVGINVVFLCLGYAQQKYQEKMG